jgi:hypothetical protein
VDGRFARRLNFPSWTLIMTKRRLARILPVRAGQMFGTVRAEDYGLAWSAVAVPEPASLMLLVAGGLFFFGFMHRRKPS